MLQKLRLKIKYLPIDQLSSNPSNPRTHTKKQIKQLARSIRQFGFVNPLIVDSSGRILAGHGRLEAAKMLSMSEVPTIRLDHMTEADKRAYALAHNRLAELADWDEGLLSLELQYLSEIDINFDVAVTGFEGAEIDLLIQANLDRDEDPIADRPAPIASGKPPVTQPGDLWVVGRHRLLCGDARDESAYRRLLGSKRADLVFADPPYNVPIANHVSGLGRIQHREFAMAAGEMSEPDFIQFLETILCHCAMFSRDGSIHYVCIDWRHLFELQVAGRSSYAEQKNICIWVKTNAGMGSLYRSQHELIVVFKKGTAPHVNNVELGRHGRHRSNVWTYAGMNSFGVERAEALATHPTVKPVALVADTLLDCSRRGAVVLDPFTGSGTTIIAAERTGRCAYALEIDPLFIDGAIRRYQSYTGDSAIHATTGLTFQETADRNRSTIVDIDRNPVRKRLGGRRQNQPASKGSGGASVRQVPAAFQSQLTANPPDPGASREDRARPQLGKAGKPRRRHLGKPRHA